MTSEMELPPLRDVINRHGLSAKKSFGQNFLLDINLTRRIARTAGSLDSHTIIEVGPGPGGLTRALLLEGAQQVIAIEKDERCLNALAELAEAFPGKLKVILGDALDIDLQGLVDGPARIVANLPYNVATPLLMNWVQPSSGQWPPFWDNLTLMFQKEVGERITSAPNTKAYGRLSVACQWHCECQMMFDVSRSAFTPPPKVTSSIVQITPKQEYDATLNMKTLERVTSMAFGQRRKMLRASLKGLVTDVESLLESLDISPTARAETLTVEQFCRLSKALDMIS